MTCCGQKMRVVDSRPSAGSSQRRRYRCPQCEKAVTTVEVVVEANNERVSKAQIEALLEESRRL